MAIKVSVIPNKDGRLECFSLNTADGRVKHRWQDKPNGAWHAGWAGLGTINTGQEVATSRHADGRIGVFVTAGNGDVWTREQASPGANFKDWYNLGGSK
jgi:hypothetical protein